MVDGCSCEAKDVGQVWDPADYVVLKRDTRLQTLQELLLLGTNVSLVRHLELWRFVVAELKDEDRGRKVSMEVLLSRCFHVRSHFILYFIMVIN